VILKSYAKVNLHLEVLNLRDDGYHNILSVMAKISLFDLLNVKNIDLVLGYSAPDFSLDFSGENSFSLQKENLKSNLIYKAFNFFLKKNGLTGKLDLTLEKNIPIGAGLGGGSSNAAVILNFLNSQYPEAVSLDYNEIALELGADVPFFMNEGVCIAEDLGQKLETLSFKSDFWVLLINDGIAVNTGKAYGLMDRKKDSFAEIEIEEKRDFLKKFFLDFDKNKAKIFLKNDFEDVVFKVYPELLRIKNELYDENAFFSAMTGSGSTVFGLFKFLDDAKDAEEKFKKKYRQVYLSKIIL